MKADSAVILLTVGALLLLGILGFLITSTETEDQVVPGGDPNNPDDYIQVTSEIRPFFKVGLSSIVFGLIILLIFALVAGASRLRGA